MHAGVGLDAENMYLLEQVGAYLHSVGMPYIVGAVWNVSPQELLDSVGVQAVAGQVACSRLATHESGQQASELDYFVVTADIRHEFEQPKSTANEYIAQHRAVHT